MKTRIVKRIASRLQNGIELLPDHKSRCTRFEIRSLAGKIGCMSTERQRRQPTAIRR
jgi:hypothetical protein